MDEVVIDTNVLLVADGQHRDASLDCFSACVARLEEVRKSSIVVIDEDYRILGEYQNKLNSRQPKSIGGAFLKWLMQNKENPARVAQVSLTEHSQDCFTEFPVAALEPEFDPPDRKFPSVANAHPGKPPILQATDSKWLKWWQELAKAGIHVEFLCPEDVCRFFEKKFPDEPVTDLP